MTISYIAGASAESTSISSMPSHQAGDLLLMFGYNSGSTTRVTIPSGWTACCVRTGNTQASVVAFKVAASGAETSGTWTNATILACAVYRDSVNYVLPGGWNGSSSGATVTVNFNAITAYSSTSAALNMWRQQSGDSWCVGCVGVVGNTSNIETAPSGMTNRVNRAGSGSREISVHDTNGNVLSWASTDYTQSVSLAYQTLTLEIFDTGIAKSGGGYASTQVYGTDDLRILN